MDRRRKTVGDSADRAASDTGNHYASAEHLRGNIAGAEFAVVPGCG
jgi:hypothetical protein